MYEKKIKFLEKMILSDNVAHRGALPLPRGPPLHAASPAFGIGKMTVHRPTSPVKFCIVCMWLTEPIMSRLPRTAARLQTRIRRPDPSSRHPAINNAIALEGVRRIQAHPERQSSTTVNKDIGTSENSIIIQYIDRLGS